MINKIASHFPPKPVSHLVATRIGFPKLLTRIGLYPRFASDSYLFQMRVEPRQRALDHVALVLRFREQVSLMFVNHQLRLHSLGLQPVPEFERLRRRAFTVAIAHNN